MGDVIEGLIKESKMVSLPFAVPTPMALVRRFAADSGPGLWSGHNCLITAGRLHLWESK